VNSTRKPWWQQATALVSISTGGAITGFSFAPGTPAQLTMPTSIPVHLMALEKAGRPAQTTNAALRSAIVNVANYYLRLAATRSPAEMEALIWQKDSIDGVDHGETCAAFASLTLELGAQAVGQESWVTGGTSYPWPLRQWADVRVDPNPDSLNIISVLQDAQAHDRWHPLGDGYQPQPGDWVLFDQHVEVVTQYSDGVLYTIGGDSLPNFSVNAHQYSAPLDGDGVVGFVDNGNLASANSSGTQTAGNGTSSQAADGGASASVTGGSRGAASQAAGTEPAKQAKSGQAAIPGMLTAGYAPSGSGQTLSGAAAHSGSAQSGSAADRSASSQPASSQSASSQSGSQGGDGTGSGGGQHESAPHQSRRAAERTTGRSDPAIETLQGGVASAGVPAAVPAAPSVTVQSATPGTSVIPGAPPADTVPGHPQATRATPYRRQASSPTATSAPTTSSQQAFINEVAPGAIAAQQQWGVPAAVTIAQAIEESTWGQSSLAADYNNLFGIKGTGPAGSVTLPTQEFENGQYVTIMAPFRVYHDVAESIADHGQLLATSGYYTQAMADRASPDAFANDLTGVYATDPNYGANLISLMRLYNLYRYDSAAPDTAPGANGTTATQAAPGQTHSAVPHGAPATHPHTGAPGGATIPGLQPAYTTAAYVPAATAARPAPAATPSGHTPTATMADYTSTATTSGYARAATTAARRPLASTASSTGTVYARQVSSPASKTPGKATQRSIRASVVRYQQLIPPSIMTSFITTAKAPLMHSKAHYQEVADQSGIRWELLAACDWMQCKARPKYSPVHGEKLGTTNSDGTIYRTKSDALVQCADDLIELSGVVYGIDLIGRSDLSVDDLASVFAAFRWGGLLRRHGIPATEFPYSMAGLTARHLDMRWPSIGEADLPDKPGTRFRKPFGAVPIILGLHYPAIV
jgi:flagellum-specific peptidoglycan hydrolase FlgJ